MDRLAGQVAIVTGGATGIGGATARRLAEEGARVLIADINVPLAQEQVERIRSSGGTAESIEADAGQHDDIQKMVARAVDLWGSLRILVNNAYSPSGADGAGGAEEVTEMAWDRGMAVLVKSMFLGAKYAVPVMQRSGGGSIVNISSGAGLRGSPLAFAYSATKWALRGMTKSAAMDLARRKIRVNSVHPGPIETDMISWRSPEETEKRLKMVPLRRHGTADEVARLVLFLLSDESQYITGAEVAIDGGITA